jgi:hypothetical protein
MGGAARAVTEHQPEPIEPVPMKVASIDDLIAMKLSAIAGRGARRDFWDLWALLAASKQTLAGGLAHFQRKFEKQDIGHVIRSLAYFGDAEAEPMPAGLTPVQWAQIRPSFETAVRAL